MKNSIIYSFFVLFITYGCTVKTYVNEDIRIGYKGGSLASKIESEIKKNIIYKRSGKFVYPNMDIEYTLKRGKFNGPFIIMDVNDTIFYCIYKNNLPIGRYIRKRLEYNKDIFYFKTIPVKPKLNYGIGSGFFNQNNKKDGIWDEDGIKIIYKNGEKLHRK